MYFCTGIILAKPPCVLWTIVRSTMSFDFIKKKQSQKERIFLKNIRLGIENVSGILVDKT